MSGRKNKHMKFKTFIIISSILLNLILLSCSSSQSGKHVQLQENNESSINKSSAQISGKIIKELTALPTSFNPTLNDSVILKYSLRYSGIANVYICDEDGFPIRHLVNQEARKKDKLHSEVWNGKDDFGNVVPDEAYFPLVTITTNRGSDTLNPLLLSGGVEIVGQNADYNRRSQVFTYNIDQASRMIGRAGKKNGVLLKTIVDSKPRLKGAVSEPWDGSDDYGLQNLFENNEKITAIVYGYTLPSPFVISYGNNERDYLSYKRELDTLKVKRYTPDALYMKQHKISKHFLQSRLYDHAPKVAITFPQCRTFTKDSIPLLSNKALVKVDIIDHDKQFKQEQYEITFSLDNVFYAEEEVGYTPYNWLWRLGDIPKGEHLLTVNLSSFNDRVGSKSVRIIVE